MRGRGGGVAVMLVVVLRSVARHKVQLRWQVLPFPADHEYTFVELRWWVAFFVDGTAYS